MSEKHHVACAVIFGDTIWHRTRMTVLSQVHTFKQRLEIHLPITELAVETETETPHRYESVTTTHSQHLGRRGRHSA
jgi:hypothetical protein